ncbi:MAG: zinc ribbon domain-containing protein [Thermodesulfobacteriota bacterium]
MFFFIGGIQPKTVTLEKQARTCPRCGHVGLSLKRVDHYVSLFFIPLFPVKRGAPFVICDHCNSILQEHDFSMAYQGPEKEKRCPSCGRKVEPEFAFCPYCGKPLS